MNTVSTKYDMLSQYPEIAAITVNTFAKVIDYNSKALELFPEINTNSNIFDFFSEERSQLLEVFFLESKNQQKSVSKEIAIESNIVETKYIITIQPDISDDNLFVFTLKPDELIDKNLDGIKFKVNVPIDDKIGDRKDVLRILEMIKSSYPFTFIEKNNLQREINKISDFFWIKDIEGKYSIVNNSYSSVHGLKPIQLEGRSVAEFIPPYLVNINSAIEKYLVDTSSAVIVEGVFNSLLNNFNEKKEIIEYPICDIDNKVIAIIGLSNSIKETAAAISEDNIMMNTFSSMQQAVVIINNNGIITNYSNELKNLFGIKGENNLTGLSINTVVPGSISNKLNEIIYKLSPNVKIDEKFSASLKEKGRIRISVKSISHSNKQDVGLLVSFTELEDENKTNESKVKMYDVIMKSSPEPIFIYDVENLKFLKVNKAAQKLYGYSQEEFLQLDLTDLYTPEDIQTLLQSSNSAIEEGRYTGPWRHQKKDGTTILVEISKFGYEYNGKLTHINMVRNVTENIEKEKELKILRASLENTSDIIVTIDSDGFIVDCNSSIKDHLGYSKEELTGRPLLSLVADNERSRVTAEILNSGITRPEKIKFDFKKHNGDILGTNIVATPIINYAGDVDSYNIVIKPVIIESEKTIEKVLESSMLKDIRDMSSNELNKNFLSNLFHEMLTPINVIMGFVQEINESIPNPTEDQKEATSIIKENQKMLLSLMDNVIEYVSIEEDETELDTETITFVDILDDLEVNVKKPLSENNIDFNYGRISSSLVLDTDKQKLTTLLTLLVKIIAEVTQEKKIILSATSYNSENILISLKDNRSAISGHLLKVLNEIFKSDEETIRKTYGISRLTMRLAQKLIKLLSVELLVVSKGNKPAEFGLLLPSKIEEESIQITKLEDLDDINSLRGKKVKPEYIETINPEKADRKFIVEQPAQQFIETEKVVAEPFKPAIEEPVSATIHQIQPTENKSVQVNVNLQAPETAVSSKTEESIVAEKFKHKEKKWTAEKLKEMSCLYLEDQMDSQILFKVQMKDIHNIDFAVSFEEALPLLKSNTYDFIIMDINLKGEYNGLDALKIIKSMSDYQDIPVVASTAYVLPGDREKFINFGFCDFISKPVMRDNIVETLDKLFN
ncbi:MAG: PAS domain S-box protein [Tenericutes bacterium]|nr:PAS domain S-box protein [Mycoplasmatota bacterium]MBI9009671.1 PAS domain S-box protein [Mycoplasmatota bacterium]